MEPLYATYEFHYADFKLEPYAGSTRTSSQLLKDIIKKLGEPDFPAAKKEINRTENQTGAPKRRLVNISSPFEQQGKRCFGKLALIKNRAPMTLTGKDIIEEIENPQNKEFIEVTNYVINFNDNSNPVIMIEFNHSGPRLSDIEYYFRQIAREYKIAKAINNSLHLDTDYNKLDRELENVFNLTVKVNSTNLNYNNRLNWLASLMNLKEAPGYKDVRLELFFQRQKDIRTGLFKKNVRALGFARAILEWLKKSDNNIEYVDDLKMTYMVEGSDQEVNLDFLKNKKRSVINVELYNKTQHKASDFKFAVGQEFNYYLSTGKTNIAIP